MNVLVVGSGGREHALCWALRKSPSVDQIYCAPGNGGIGEIARCVDIDGEDFSALIGFCKAENIAFVVVGPEAPLVDGLVDALAAAGIKAFGPNAAAAMLEGSKGFMKDLCAKYGIPTAAYARFSDAGAAKAYVAAQSLPIVIKADGLAAGKGVVIAADLDEANDTIDDILGGRFGQAGAEIVVEEFLQGEEASCFALVDGKSVVMLASAQDHKAVGDGDTGPNTGGMGAYSPAPVVTDAMAQIIADTIVRPTVDAMAAEGRPFRGVLFAGLMICDGVPKLLEYNIRFGDPECQVLMARLESDLLPLLLATCDGTLDAAQPVWSDDAALVVVMAAQGYPGAYEKGSVIGNLGAANDLPGVIVFHAGTKVAGGKVIANGGRVLGVTARGPTIAIAQERAYEAVSVIDWPEGFCRTDIGWRAIGR